MAIFKCICCGEEIESEKELSCPECGYRMFPVPYNKKDKLIEEIKNFAVKLQPFYIRNDDIELVDKKKDDQRFPSFDKLQGYVCTAPRSEVFYKRLNESLENLKKFYHACFEKDYQTKTTSLKERIKDSEEVLTEVLNKLNLDPAYQEVDIGEITVHYSEIPDDALISIADEIIDVLTELNAKIKKFIAVNNMYGNGFREKKKKDFKFNEDNNYLIDLQQVLSDSKKIVNKKYFVDIFDDGSKELKEMTICLWTSIWVIMKLPLLTKKYCYKFADGTECVDDEYKEKLLGILGKRYDSINIFLQDTSVLTDKDETELFYLYNDMLKLDKFNIMRSTTTNLLYPGESEKKLNKLIGLETVKNSIQKIKAYVLANKDNNNLNLHMCFYGNPGTGKTEVARIIAGILHENKILPINKVVEVDRGGLVGQYVGETPQKTMAVINQAMGGVLFIDEAYALVSGPGSSHFDYGHEAVATLIKAMEDYRGKFCVILAGYQTQMETMLASNPGFVSRIQFKLHFPNYDREELKQITKLMLSERNYDIDERSMNKILDILDVRRKDQNFANAREVRNILDQVIMCQNLRVGESENRSLAIADVNKYIEDAGIILPLEGEGRKARILTGEEELDNLIGLKSVKKTVKKINAYAKRNARNPDFNLHMCFYGNPGTGKTEVARILSRILYDAGVLKEAKLVETDAFGLIGKAIGETGPKTKAKIQEALGGVLFIDEAYALANGSGTAVNYGSEAVSVLLKEMEDNRGQFCAILAGYKNEMQRMLASNPGFESRLQFTLEFPDYTREELGQIAELMLKKKKFTITDEALSRVLDITDFERERPNYANTRNVRNILDQVILNQNLRTDGISDNNNEIILEDVEDYINEKGWTIPKEAERQQAKINFDAMALKDDYFEFEEDIDTAYIEQSVISISSPASQGTGFIISKDGFCLTCSHCIEGNGSYQKARLSLLLANGKVFHTYTTFKLVARDAQNDIALIKLDETDIEYNYLPLSGANYKYNPLKEFIMAGYPFGGESYSSLSFTEGKIASVNQIDERKVVFADMFGKPGNSGSPVIDKSKQRVIGIFWGGITQPGTSEMIPCFTPVDVVWNLLNTADN